MAQKPTIPRRKKDESQAEHLARSIDRNAVSINRSIVSNLHESHQLQRVYADHAFQNRRLVVPGVTPDMLHSLAGLEEARTKALAAAATGQMGVKDANDFINMTLSHGDRLVAEAITKMRTIARDLAERRRDISAMKQIPDAEVVTQDEPKQIQSPPQEIISPSWHSTPEEQKARNVKETAPVHIRPEGTR